MRILYDNKIKVSTLTATTESYNFPLGNLIDNLLSLPFKATDITVDVTIVFDAPTKVNCVGVAGHNATEVRVSLYTLAADTAWVLRSTNTPVHETDMFYNDDVMVEKVVVRFEGSSLISVGSLMVGEFYDMPKPNAYYAEKYVITNQRTDTAFGGVYGSDGVMLLSIDPTFAVVDHAQYKEITAIIRILRNYNPAYVDMTALNHVYREPMYATMNMSEVATQRDKRRDLQSNPKHSFSLTIKEAR